MKNLSVRLRLIKTYQTAGLAVAAAVLAIAALAAVFLFSSRANAQNIRQFAAPSFACQFYRGQQGFSIERNLEHDCLVRNGDSQTGFVYTHFYDSGGNFCIEVTSTFGRVFGPQCIPISQTGRAEQQRQEEQEQGTSPKIVTPPAFQIKELQYDTLPTGRPVQAGENERIEITMPDGSLIQLDANATFTPVSDRQVHSVFGRYRYLWRPFHDGMCIVGQNLVRQQCRRVQTPDGFLGDRGTEFLVESDKSGTTVTVLDGTVIATDLSGKKTVEVAAGQSAFIKKGGLPEDPKSYDPAKIDRWWEKKTSEQNFNTFIGIAVIVVIAVVGLVIIVSLLSLIIKKIFRRNKPTTAATSAAEGKDQTTPDAGNNNSKMKKNGFCLGCIIFIIILITFLSVAAVFYSIQSSSPGK